MSQYAEKPILISVRVEIYPKHQGAFVDWQAADLAAAIPSPGFISLEVHSLNSPEGVVDYAALE